MKFVAKLKMLVKNVLPYPAIFFTFIYEAAIRTAFPLFDGLVRGAVIDALAASVRTVTHQGIELRFYCPNAVTVYRTQTFSTKEPETLAWIDEFSDGSILWDIGANVGLYSIYAAKRHLNLRVYAFEPSILNLELLARNLALNGLEKRVCIIPLALFGKTGEDRFILSSMERGESMSAFGVDYGYDGQKLSARLEYGTLGISMDDLREKFSLEVPDFIKMDVDGIEHIILRGGAATLKEPRLKSMLVELNEDFAHQQAEASSILGQNGLVMAEKRHSSMIADSKEFGRTFNTIWVRATREE